MLPVLRLDDRRVWDLWTVHGRMAAPPVASRRGTGMGTSREVRFAFGRIGGGQ
jgi:hypothetical protein